LEVSSFALADSFALPPFLAALVLGAVLLTLSSAVFSEAPVGAGQLSKSPDRASMGSLSSSGFFESLGFFAGGFDGLPLKTRQVIG